jgi:hypothetical protein
MIGTYLVHGWLHFFMVQVDYILFVTGWCMVDALVYGTYWCMFDSLFIVQVEVQVDAWFKFTGTGL